MSGLLRRGEARANEDRKCPAESPKASIPNLLEVFERGRVAIVMDGDKFLGLITRTDLLSYLRLHMPKESAPVEREFS